MQLDVKESLLSTMPDTQSHIGRDNEAQDLPIIQVHEGNSSEASQSQWDTEEVNTMASSLSQSSLSDGLISEVDPKASDQASGTAFQYLDGRTYVFRTQKPSDLCRYCQHIVDYFAIPGSWPVTPHHNQYSHLERSRADGCSLCAQFVRGYESLDTSDYVPDMDSLGFLVGDANILHPSHSSKSRVIELCWKRDRGEGSIYRLTVGRIIALEYTDNVCEAQDRIESLHLSINTIEGLQLAKQWLSECCKSHKTCSTAYTTNKNIRPSRLVFVGDSAPRLFISATSGGHPDYATLSHCWGTSTFLTLTTSNLQTFQRRIPSEALSKTFHEAIHTTRALGLNYLWIDSLCIVQNDPDDWQRESVLMRSIYGGSTINIAASGAADGNEGCFFRRPSDWLCQIDIGITTIGDRRIIKFVPADMYSKFLVNTPLQQRAWAFQERLLSPRTIHLTQTQVFWECYQITASETFPHGISEAITSGKDVMYFLNKQPVTFSMWSWIVQRYSECLLTKESDKLVALSGLAEKVQLQTKDRYVAGLWMNNIEKQLLWTPVRGPTINKSHRYSSYTAPSWSWASIHGAIELAKWADVEIDTCIHVSNIDITPAGRDPLGAILGAQMSVKCNYMLVGTISLNNDLRLKSSKNIRVNGSMDVDLSNQDTDQHNTVFLLPVGLENHFLWKAFKGLLLQPTNKKPGQYQRVGYFDTPLFMNDHSNNPQNNPECFAGDDHYESVRTDAKGERECTIELV